MKKILFISLIVFLLSICYISPVFATSAPEEVLDASASVVYIEVESSTEIGAGSGFVISNDAEGTFIATNYHVVEGNLDGVSVWVGENDKRSATVVAGSNEYDLAIIKLFEPIDAKALVLSSNANQGEEVFAIGYPAAANALSNSDAHLSNEATITNGIIGSIRTMNNVDYGPDLQLLQINAEINFGNSGGPLLNNKGEVVGVNTYGVLDSQGIFGAISASELINFMEINNLDISISEPSSPNWIAYILIALAVIIIMFLIIFMIKIRKRSKKGTSKELKLNAYLEKLKGPLDAHSVVSLVMPIMLQLRDMHNNGNVYLGLSPMKISVSRNGCKLQELNSFSSNFSPDEFAAPEQRKGALTGIKADIYSVCALLRYLVGYKNETFSEENILNSNEVLLALNNIIDKGLSDNPDERFSNMQELILALSPFNSGISDSALGTFDVALRPKKQQIDSNIPRDTLSKSTIKKRWPVHRIIIVIAGAIILVFLSFSAINYFFAIDNAKNYAFDDAYAELNRIPFSNTLFHNDYTFIEAGSDMLNRDYDTAVTKLESLNDYENAAQLISETKYRKASMLADEKEFDEAVQIYEEISGYKDSTDLINDTVFRKACYIISTGEHYTSALRILNSLSLEGYEEADAKISELYYVWGSDLVLSGEYLKAYEKFLEAGNYLDTTEILTELKELIYYSAIDYYHSGLYYKADEWFDALDGYLNSNDYLILIEGHNQGHSLEADDWEASRAQLISLIGFEDAAEIVMSFDYYAAGFLYGTWKGDSKFFTMEKDDDGEHFSCNLPWIEYGDFYYIQDGILKLCYAGAWDDTKDLFKITVVDNDCIKIFAYKNEKTYTLYRQ